MKQNADYDAQFVYHGSPEFHDVAVPKRQIRMKPDERGMKHIIFDQISYHATHYRWIALAYTYTMTSISADGSGPYYNMGVDLYDHTKEIEIMGTVSLEESLQHLYGNGGYLLKYRTEDFHHMNGLGNLEVITLKEAKPVSIERIDDPVAELRATGVTFRFTDVLQIHDA